MALQAGSDATNVKALALRSFLGDDEGELSFDEAVKAERPVLLARLERWALQAAATAALRWAYDGPHAPRIARLVERVGKCCRVPLGGVVNVDYKEATGSASYSNLTTCGSVWVCPVCAAKITERRRLELKPALDRHTASGGKVWLLTLTFPHTKADSLPVLLERFDKALRSLWGGEAANKSRRGWGLVGHITAKEVTVGRNGWHPHAHILLVFDPTSNAAIDQVQAELLARWRRICSRVGLLDAGDLDQVDSFNARAVDLRDGKQAAAYVAKFGLERGGWDASSEVTKAHTKRGRNGSRSPWDLLRSYLEDGDVSDAHLFTEYAAAFKGKRQLRWSPGLRELLGVDEQEKSDEELAQEAGDGAHVLAELGLDDWRVVLRSGARGSVLAAARSGNPDDVWRFIGLLRDQLQAKRRRRPAPFESVTDSA